MRQKSIGEVLRSARENKGLTLGEAQRLTKIQAKYLQCLEFNDFDGIPDQEYVASFLSRYTEVLGLDSRVILDAYGKNSLVTYHENGGELELHSHLRRSYKPTKKIGDYLPLIYLLLAALFIVIFISYIVHTRMQHQSEITTASSYSVVSSDSSSEEASNSETSTTTASSSSTSSSSSSSQEEKVKLTSSGSGSQLAATLTGTTGAVEITLTVTDVTSWVSVSGTDLASGVVLSPDNKTVTTELPEGTNTASIVLGVVEGVEITIGGQKLDTSAITSNTGTITLTIE